MRQPADPGDIAGQFENPAVVDVVEHDSRLSLDGASIVSGAQVII
jgi:hypothetical protein